VGGECDLFEVVGTLGAGRRFANLLDGGQQQADQYRDDGDYHQQFDQGEATVSVHGLLSGVMSISE
jgi:hypothetical protein